MRELWLHFETEANDVKLDECGIQKFLMMTHYKYITYQNFVIHYITEGSGYFVINGIEHKLSKGDGFILRKGQEVEYFPDDKDPWKTYWIGISGDKLKTYLNSNALLTEDVLTFKADSMCKKIILEICDYSLQHQGQSIDTLWYQIKLYEFLYHARKEFPLTTIEYSPNNRNYAEIALDYIYANYAKDISITEIANYIGVTRGYLNKIFKKNFNKPPSQILLERRMRTAVTLLTTTDLSIAAISEKIGYSDPLYFSKVFSKYFDKSPTLFRKIPHDANLMEDLL